MSPIHVVGVGMAGKATLPDAILDILAQAALMVGSRRHLQLCPSGAAEQWPWQDMALTLERLKAWHQAHPDQIAVVLASGDPLFFGIGRLLLAHLGADALTFHPHVSSMQLAFSRVKLPWQDACILSVHGRAFDPLIAAFQRGEPTLAILTDTIHSPGAIARLFRDLSLPIHYRWWLCENLGAPDERVRCVAPADLLHLAVAPLNLLILQRDPDSYTPVPTPLTLLGVPDDAFVSFADRPGLMTKREVRVLAIAELAIQPAQVVWDIGAGTGSVSVEVARLCPTSQVYAIEKDAAGVQLIAQNCHRFDVPNVQVVNGQAPSALADLPHPDRIFIGGSGGQLTAILDYCAAHLAVKGILVLAVTTIEHQQIALNWFKAAGWPVQLLQVQVARSVAVAHLTRFQPLNPVVLIQAIRPRS